MHSTVQFSSPSFSSQLSASPSSGWAGMPALRSKNRAALAVFSPTTRRLAPRPAISRISGTNSASRNSRSPRLLNSTQTGCPSSPRRATVFSNSARDDSRSLAAKPLMTVQPPTRKGPHMPASGRALRMPRSAVSRSTPSSMAAHSACLTLSSNIGYGNESTYPSSISRSDGSTRPAVYSSNRASPVTTRAPSRMDSDSVATVSSSVAPISEM